MSHAARDISHDKLFADDLASTVGPIALLVGAGGLFASAVLAWIGPDSGEGFFRAYVTALAFCLTITLGALFFVLLQHLTRAGWSVVVRRLAENITASFPVLAALSLPIVVAILLASWFGWPHAIQATYLWSDTKLMHADHLLHVKTPYLNWGFFLVRMAIYFGFWCWAAKYFRGTSIEQDRTGDPALTAQMQRRSTWCMLVFALTLTFCAFDLLMSLDPTWFSTIFGVYVFAGSCVAIFSTLVVLMFWLQKQGRMMQAITTEHFHDVGKLLFAFVVFWAYIGFSQYMLIWYANLPEETPWFIVRQQGPWLFVSFLLLFGHFCGPFLFLISRWQKRNKMTLLAGAIWMLAMHWIDMFWLVFPHAAEVIKDGPQHTHAVVASTLSFWDVLRCLACLAGVGGIWLWGVSRGFAQAKLVPDHDPRLHESLAFENV